MAVLSFSLQRFHAFDFQWSPFSRSFRWKAPFRVYANSWKANWASGMNRLSNTCTLSLLCLSCFLSLSLNKIFNLLRHILSITKGGNIVNCCLCTHNYPFSFWYFLTVLGFRDIYMLELMAFCLFDFSKNYLSFQFLSWYSLNILIQVLL